MKGDLLRPNLKGMKTTSLLFILALKGYGMPPIQIAAKNLADLSPNLLGPGHQYCLVSEEGISCLEKGIADIGTQKPVTRQTTFNAFSVTKTLTATAVMRLAEQGRIDLEKSVSEYVDSLPYQPAPTLRQLLSHTSGLPNPMPLNWVHASETHAGFDEKQFICSLIAKHSELNSAPGQGFAYSNLGYLLLGLVIEKVTAMTYTQYIEAEIIAKLNLGNDTSMGFSIPQGANHALGTIRKWSLPYFLLPFIPKMKELKDADTMGWVQLKAFQVHGSAYGGLITTAQGLARFLQALMSSKVLSDASMVKMFSLQKDAKGEIPMTLGWYAGELDDQPYFTHAGGGGGYYCEVRLYPTIRRASVFMSNRAGMKDERLLDHIDKGSLFIH
jgi:D-alanyl-D-alanine carboxypeptidase